MDSFDQIVREAIMDALGHHGTSILVSDPPEVIADSIMDALLELRGRLTDALAGLVQREQIGL